MKELTLKSKTNAAPDTKTLCMTALFTAMVCICTMVIQIPIPLGYAHLGDCMVLLAAVSLKKKAGAFAAGVGSALADILTGYLYWAPATLVIKALMALIASAHTAAAMTASLLFMVAGYVISGAVIYGSLAAGLASAPGLLLKSIVNLIVFYVLAGMLKKVHLI